MTFLHKRVAFSPWILEDYFNIRLIIWFVELRFYECCHSCFSVFISINIRIFIIFIFKQNHSTLVMDKIKKFTWTSSAITMPPAERTANHYFIMHIPDFLRINYFVPNCRSKKIHEKLNSKPVTYPNVMYRKNGWLSVVVNSSLVSACSWYIN